MDRFVIQARLRQLTNEYQKSNEEQLGEQLRLVPHEEAFFGLFPFAIAAPWDEPAASLAGRLLYAVQPHCPLSCREALQATIVAWDVSHQEVPFYLVKQFGADALEASVTSLLTEAVSQEERVLLETVLYWTEIAREEHI